MNILQKTIAEKAGVSYATVSRAFTNSAKVKPQTLQKIRNAMQELGISDYDDVLLGKRFIARAVLLAVSDISNHFYSKVIKGICEGLNPLGYSILLYNYDSDSGQEISALRHAMENGYSGIIMITVSMSEEMIRFLQNTSIPIVLVNRYIPSLDLDVVRIDNYRGGYMAAKYLMEHGHKDVAMLTGVKGSGTALDRSRGFFDGMRDYGLSFTDQDIVYGDNSLKSGKQFADWLVNQSRPYTAAFIGNDYMSVGVVRRLQELNFQIPKDYSVLCFDDSYMVDESGLNLTTISCDPEMMGRSAADIFVKRQADLLGGRFRIIYSPILKERNSVQSLETINF
ncbi:LacI family DNA-binding transcriptional regulator [Pseudoflavonifractor sp. An184]|uniref:LacI family DNA-binding transcriptional regulator n=1 Tax=Pseudoflavonifractor sp. An184 TaxID=1965576 RepID=UPI000B37B119|nr:LacI family DNA-binding transcriptional regulator [Pseudoflavonifractor sp. An184]OUP49417.1 hypothetical protein B5F19_15765 [Pseudoflavonifractor sp. An184]